MGFDARGGNQPRGTLVTLNLAHDMGIYTKQNRLLLSAVLFYCVYAAALAHDLLLCAHTTPVSFFFQAESFGTVLDGNIAFNGPRAGINFNDGMGGNNTVTRNVLFNFCR